jgi:hypothetical protein
LQGSFMYSTGWWIFHMAPRVDIGQHSDFLVRVIFEDEIFELFERI